MCLDTAMNNQAANIEQQISILTAHISHYGAMMMLYLSLNEDISLSDISHTSQQSEIICTVMTGDLTEQNLKWV